MTISTASSIDISPEVRAWAKNKLTEDKEYIQYRAQFAPEPIKSIAKLILVAGQGIQK